MSFTVTSYFSPAADYGILIPNPTTLYVAPRLRSHDANRTTLAIGDGSSRSVPPVRPSLWREPKRRKPQAPAANHSTTWSTILVAALRLCSGMLDASVMVSWSRQTCWHKAVPISLHSTGYNLPRRCFEPRGSRDCAHGPRSQSSSSSRIGLKNSSKGPVARVGWAGPQSLSRELAWQHLSLLGSCSRFMMRWEMC